MLAPQLEIELGQCSHAGTKAINQDFYGASIPPAPLLHRKGAAFAIADGISSSGVSQIASETAIKSFLNDYYCTSDAWSIAHAAEQVVRATNAWLYSQTRHSPYWQDPDKGYVCTFTALIIHPLQVCVVHLGDTRLYRVRDQRLELLTRDHRHYTHQQSYLSKALGAYPQVDIDHQQFTPKENDLFLLMTDGLYEFVKESDILYHLANAASLDDAAQQLIATALAAGSQDNLTVQIIRIVALKTPIGNQSFALVNPDGLAVPPILNESDSFDGFNIVKTLHSSARSHLYLVEDAATKNRMVLKTLSLEQAENQRHLERLLLEEWITRRVNNPHVLKPASVQRDRRYLYTLCEYIEGQSLAQWQKDNPHPSLEQVRTIIEQVGQGLQALHRSEILHQDIRPENIIIDHQGRAKIIDLGSAYLAGVAQWSDPQQDAGLGTALYAAPEYFVGQAVSEKSDLFSLAVLTYFLLSGRFPYGTKISRCRTLTAMNKIGYQSLSDEKRSFPHWLDKTLAMALQPSPEKRYETLSEFLYDLRHPNPKHINSGTPMLQRDPLRFWQTTCALLIFVIIYLFYLLHAG